MKIKALWQRIPDWAGWVWSGAIGLAVLAMLLGDRFPVPPGVAGLMAWLVVLMSLPLDYDQLSPSWRRVWPLLTLAAVGLLMGGMFGAFLLYETGAVLTIGAPK